MTDRSLSHSDAFKRFTEAVASYGDLITDQATLTERGHDFWGVGATADLLLRPHDRDQIAAIMTIAAEYGVPVVPRGGASNCSGGMMPGAGRVLLDLSGLNQILEVDVAGRRARVERHVVVTPHGFSSCGTFGPTRPGPTGR